MPPTTAPIVMADVVRALLADLPNVTMPVAEKWVADHYPNWSYKRNSLMTTINVCKAKARAGKTPQPSHERNHRPSPNHAAERLSMPPTQPTGIPICSADLNTVVEVVRQLRTLADKSGGAENLRKLIELL